MSWVTELCGLYDANQETAGKTTTDGLVLLPLYHSSVAAQITVTLDENGEFLKAERVGDEEKATIIPVTEKSASRTSSPDPHPLCDNLEYLAGDYDLYVKEKKENQKDKESKHSMYMELLQQWKDSPYSHPKVEAVYRYLQKGTLMGDLYRQGVFELEADGSISEKAKIQVVAQTKAFVRFRILTKNILGADRLQDEQGAYFEECWKDRSLQQAYIDFCKSRQADQDLSYLTGKRTAVTYYHPKKIRNEGDGSKLFSANDAENYTFRGRFATREEAFAIGYEDSQKLHNALKWLIRKQGKNYGDLCIVTWDSCIGHSLEWTEDTDRICEQALEDGDIWIGEESGEVDTGEIAAARFHQAIAGYRSKLDKNASTMILAFDAATTGRLSMVENKEYESSRYVENIQNWYMRCEWEHWKNSKEKGRYSFLGMVGIKDIAELLYGTEEKGKGYFSLKGKEGLYKEVAKRMLPCILEGKKVPMDMVRLAVQRASNPVAFESRFLWERILSLACSLIKQDRRDKEDWTMALDVTCRKRDYLYGRLLALADRVEYRTYDVEEDAKRPTNAKRFMNAFAQRPYRTWLILENKLAPYWMQLKPGERVRYQNLLDEIMNLFEMDDFQNDGILDGTYLLGFHNQSYALRMKKENSQEETK